MIITGSAILTIPKTFQNINVLTLFVETAIAKISAITTETQGQKDANDKIISELRLIAASSGFSAEYRYWVLLCGLFSPTRNIVKNWK